MSKQHAKHQLEITATVLTLSFSSNSRHTRYKVHKTSPESLLSSHCAVCRNIRHGECFLLSKEVITGRWSGPGSSNVEEGNPEVGKKTVTVMRPKTTSFIFFTTRLGIISIFPIDRRARCCACSIFSLPSLHDWCCKREGSGGVHFW